jgi:hypothetical protein
MPDVIEQTSHGSAAWAVKKKLFAWERPLRKSDLEALGSAAPRGPILGLRTRDLETKEMLIASDPSVYFTTPHFDGYAAVLVRLERIGTKELKAALTEAWLTRAPKRSAGEFLQSRKVRRND